MTHFYGVCHKNCALRYVGWVIEVTKLDFRGLIGKLDVKKGNFRGLKAKICQLRPILASRTTSWPIFLEYSMGIVP